MVESRSSRWTPQEDALLRRMAEASVRPEIIAVKLNRTVHAVKARAYMIGLPLKWFKLKEEEMTGTPRAPWTPEQDKKLRALVLNANSVDTIAEALNRTTFAVRRRANTLRIPLRKIARASETDLIRRLVELGLKAKK